MRAHNRGQSTLPREDLADLLLLVEEVGVPVMAPVNVGEACFADQAQIGKGTSRVGLKVGGDRKVHAAPPAVPAPSLFQTSIMSS